MADSDTIIDRVKGDNMTDDVEKKDKKDFEQLGQSEEDIDTRIEKNNVLAYGLFDGSKSGIPLMGKGIKELVRTGTGTYTLVFSESLLSNNYIVLVTPSQERIVWVHSKLVGQFKVTTEDNASAAADTNRLNMVVIQ